MSIEGHSTRQLTLVCVSVVRQSGTPSASKSGAPKRYARQSQDVTDSGLGLGTVVQVPS